ncbi:MAG: hypothetical protein KDC54_16445, partial [Lewinella sp.]|nr:hypothetical protein [Lewinella sp.]
MDFQARYRQEQGQKTRRIGLIVALLAIVTISYFYYVDISTLSLANTLPWRICGVSGGLLFLLSLKWQRSAGSVVAMHALTLALALVMMSGISYEVFTNSDSSTEHFAGATIGFMSVWMIISVVAFGARRLMVIVSSILLVIILVLYLGLPAAQKASLLGYFSSVMLMGLFALLVMYLQEHHERQRAWAMYELEASRDRITEQAQDLATIHENLLTFTRAMSHDLQGPLRRVQSFLDLFERRQEKPLQLSAQEYLDLAR